MKLTIEIVDYVDDGKLQHWILSRIVPTDNREGISTHDKQGQTEKLARLIDLSKAVDDCVERFYSKANASIPSQSTEDVKPDFLDILLAQQEKSQQEQGGHHQ